MDSHDLLKNCEYNLNGKVLFRGRKNNHILTEQDMYHIPFNRRYLIENQRYSVTGQPLLYLGFSILDVVAELNIDLDDKESVESLKISTFALKENFMVYDLRNRFYRYFKSNLVNSVINLEKDVVSINSKRIEKEFYKLILSSCCSFKGRKNTIKDAFCEEYVLPQLLASLIKETYISDSSPIKDKYQGILYASTHFTICDNNEYDNSIYRNNVAIYTNLNDDIKTKKTIYDESLIEKFKVSCPISYTNIQLISIRQLKEICEAIIEIDINKYYQLYYLLASEFEAEIKNLAIKGTSYINLEIGKIHLYLLYQFLVEVRNTCIKRNEETIRNKDKIKSKESDLELIDKKKKKKIEKENKGLIEKNILIQDILSECKVDPKIAISKAKGQMVYTKISNYMFNDNYKIKLNFNGVERIAFNFLNYMLRGVYYIRGKAWAKEHLFIEGLSDEHLILLHFVIVNILRELHQPLKETLDEITDNTYYKDLIDCSKDIEEKIIILKNDFLSIKNKYEKVVKNLLDEKYLNKNYTEKINILLKQGNQLLKEINTKMTDIDEKRIYYSFLELNIDLKKKLQYAIIDQLKGLQMY